MNNIRQQIAEHRSTNINVMGIKVQLVTFEEKQLLELIEAHTRQARIEELTMCLKEAPMPTLSYEDIQNRIAKLEALQPKEGENGK